MDQSTDTLASTNISQNQITLGSAIMDDSMFQSQTQTQEAAQLTSTHIYQSPLILTELFQHNLINVSYLTACYLYQVMMTLHFLDDVQQIDKKLRHNRYFEECSTMGKLINRIPGSRLLISSLPGSPLRTHVESLSLAW